MTSASATARDADRLAALETEITRRIREFEVSALLDLLDAIGYPPRRVEFRGHLAHGPQPSLLHAIEFPPRTGPAHVEPKVLVTVNLGLLSCRSPLPSYFRRFLADMDSRDAVLELLELLDRSLLHTRFTSDGFARTIDDWSHTQRDCVRSFGLDTPIGLEWLFRKVFPELGVRVHRRSDEHSLPFAGAMLGGAMLGECSFGRRTRIGVHEIEVTLICPDATIQGELSWVVEGDRRLRSHVFPLLDEVCLSLTISFVLLDREARARLSSRSYAGYDPMWADHADALDQPARVELYRGALPREEPDTDELELELGVGGDADAELSLDRYASSPSEPVLGRTVALRVIFLAPARRYVYEVAVHWGARAWYRDEPRAIELRCQGVRKTPATPRQHPRLWTWMRDGARRRIADRLTHELMTTADSERVTVDLVDELLGRGELERLYALVWSEVAPMDVWDDEAWRRFSSWSVG